MTQDVKDRKLPGGSLLSAYLDRQLMVWSDRGGASHHIGDRWAAHCSGWLDNAFASPWPVQGVDPLTVSEIIRLDDIQAVSREANQYHLENPDFLIIGYHEGTKNKARVLAVDAKFAADRIKTSQVSAQIVENLITIPESGVTRRLVENATEAHGFAEYDTIDGAFLCPDSILTDFLIDRRARGRSLAGVSAEIIRIKPDPGTMFNGLPAGQLIGMLARQDSLPVTPRENLLSAIYYFRVASACMHLWQEQHLPLFTIHEPPPPEPGMVGADLVRRATPGQSAYKLMLGFVDDAEEVQRARQAVANVAALPLRMTELRSLVQHVGRGDHKTILRALRRDLELEFRRRLFDRVGEIRADDPRPLGTVLNDVGAAARDLRPHMQDIANQSIVKHAVASAADATG